MKNQTLHSFVKENSTTKSHFCKENKLLEGKKRLLSLFFSYETLNFQKRIFFFIIIIISLRIFFGRNLNWIFVVAFLLLHRRRLIIIIIVFRCCNFSLIVGNIVLWFLQYRLIFFLKTG